MHRLGQIIHKLFKVIHELNVKFNLNVYLKDNSLSS